MDTEISRPTTLVNSIFMSTANMAAKTLVSLASTEHAGKWKASDHLRYMFMLLSWITLWVLRVLMDHFPASVGPSNPGYVGSFEPLLSSPSSPSYDLSAMDQLVLSQELTDGFNGPPIKALGRALSHIFALLNEIPASSRKYQFAVAMADKIVDENARNGHVELLEINRAALSSAFARTSSLLCRFLQKTEPADESGAWHTRVISAMPLGSYLASYLKGISFCVGAIFPSLTTCGWQSGGRRQTALAGGEEGGERIHEVAAEKLGQELLWITNKLMACGAVDEAVAQWSIASRLASLSLTTSPRVQAFIVKISALLLREVNEAKLEVPRQVKLRLLVLWLPLFCYASNGLAYPILSAYEKDEVERVMDDLISTLPTMDQELILSNWLQDYAISASDWPNLQVPYERWCQASRKLVP